MPVAYFNQRGFCRSKSDSARRGSVGAVSNPSSSQRIALARKNQICGCSSSGRAPPCQGGGSGFEPRHPLQNKRTPFWCPFCFTMGWARKGRFAVGEFKQSGELFERPWACRQAGAQPSEPRHPLQNKRTPFWCPFCFTMGWARKGRFAVGEFKQSGELFERPWACALCSFFALIVGCDDHIAP